jgi:putative flippase GtrA
VPYLIVTHSAEQAPDFVLFQFGRFLVVGGIATALQYAILLALTGAAGVKPLLGSSIGFLASATANYTLNRRFTFHSDVHYFAGLERFAIIAGCGLALNAIVMGAGMDLAGMNYFASQLVATAVVLMWNFNANRLWTFPIDLADSPKSTQENLPLTGWHHDRERPRDPTRE